MSNRDPLSTELLTSLNISRRAYHDEIFKVNYCTCKSGSREPNHAPFGVTCHPFGKNWYSLLVYKIWQFYLQPFLWYEWGPKIYEKLSCFRENARHASQYRNLANTKHPIWKSLQLTNDVDVHPMVIAIAAFKQAVHHFLFVACCYNVSIKHRFGDNNTFQVYMTVWDLKTLSLLTVKLKSQPCELSNLYVNTS